MASQVSTYQLDDSTTVSFVIEPTEGIRPAGPAHVAGKVRVAVSPAIEAAREVLDQVKELGPDEAVLTFGVKVTGGAQWFVAKAASEANFKIMLKWSHKDEEVDS